MLVKMKRYEKLAGDYAKRFAKGWDYYCIATGAYLAGYREATAEAASIVFNQMGVSHWTEEDTIELIKNKPNDEVKVEVNDGEHQLSTATFNKWKEEVKNLPFKEALATFLEHYEFDDVRVHEDKGVISFQGTARKK